MGWGHYDCNPEMGYEKWPMFTGYDMTQFRGVFQEVGSDKPS